MPDHSFTQVSYARRADAGWITLDRPARRNALSPVMIAELHQALDLVAQDPAVRALIITGAGPAFCAGADLGYFQSLLDAEDGCDRFVDGLLRPLGDFLARLRGSPAPVIAAGELRAKQLHLLSGSWDAATMAAFGLVTDVVEPDGLQARAAALASTLGQRSPQSLAMLKDMVHRSLDPPWEQTAESDVAQFRRAWGSADMREGIRAYTDHRETGFAR